MANGTLIAALRSWVARAVNASRHSSSSNVWVSMPVRSIRPSRTRSRDCPIPWRRPPPPPLELERGGQRARQVHPALAHEIEVLPAPVPAHAVDLLEPEGVRAHQ